MASQRICSVQDCGNPVLAREFCGNHYRRWRVYGDPLLGGPARHHADTCSVDGCGRKHFSKGFCKQHYGAVWLKTSGRRCSIEGCNRPHNAHGYCTPHYNRWRHHGDPHAGMLAQGQAQQYLETVVLPYDGDDCLPWPHKRTPDGYAKMSHKDGGSQLVHRRVCEATHGPAPTPKHQAAHLCGKGSEGCVAPRHVVWKTQSENMADKLLHGSHSRGERSPNAKLTERQVLEIRNLRGKMQHREIAALFGISKHTVRRIIYRKEWAWLPDAIIAPK